MISVDNRAAAKALPPPLLALLEKANAAADALNELRDKHKREHGDCNWFAGFEYPRGSGTIQPYCPTNQVLIAAWEPLFDFANCLEYFLCGGEVPAGCKGELAPLRRPLAVPAVEGTP